MYVKAEGNGNDEERWRAGPFVSSRIDKCDLKVEGGFCVEEEIELGGMWREDSESQEQEARADSHSVQEIIDSASDYA